MYLRIVLAAPLLLAFTLPAQVKPTPATQKPGAQKPVAKKPVPQDPVAQEPIALTPAQVLEQLQADKKRLEIEIRYAKERVSNAKSLLSSKLSGSRPAFRSIDAGTSITTVPWAAPIKRKYARIGSKAELEAQPEGTMLVVNGRAISDSYYSSIMDYLRESSAGDDAVRAQRALFDLIRIEAVASQYEENDGEVRLGQYIGELAKGKSIVEIAKAEGSVQMADAEGRIEVTRNSPLGPFFEFNAFTTPAGQQARPFRNLFGYVLLQVDSIEKGATPNLDKAICHAVQIDYTTDQGALKQAQFQVNSGQTEVIVRDQQVLDLLPALFKPAVMRHQPNAAMLQAQLTRLQAQLQKLEAAGEGGSDQATAIRKQCEAVKQAIKAAPPMPVQDADQDADAGAAPGLIRRAEQKKGGKQDTKTGGKPTGGKKGGR